MTEENDKQLKIGRPAGFRDFYPEEFAKVNFILDTMRRVSQDFGYVEYTSPAVELLSLYELKSGEGLLSEIFKVESRSGQKLVLIPELTPSLSRMLAEKQQNYTKPIRWFSLPRCYRDETLQRGRVKEFWQYNIDILGIDEVYADAEIMTILVTIIVEIGLSDKQFVVLVNDRSFMQKFFSAIGLSDFLSIIRILDKKDKFLQTRIQKELKGAFDEDEAKNIALAIRHTKNIDKSIFSKIPQTKATEEIVENFSYLRKDSLTQALLSSGVNPEQAEILWKLSELQAPPQKFLKEVSELYPADDARDALKNLADLAALLDSFGITKYVLFDGSLARGLDYYTGIVFEAWSREGLIPRAIAGGGRYADLVATIGGQPLTGVGLGFGETVLMEIMSDLGIAYPEREICDVYIAPIKLKNLAPVIELSRKLRKKGIKTVLNAFDWRIKRHFENAEKQNIEWMIIAGKKDLSQDSVTLRNIVSGEQELILIKDIAKVLKKKLKKK